MGSLQQQLSLTGQKPGFFKKPGFWGDVDSNRADWIYTHEKELKRQEWENERRTQAAAEGELRKQYHTDRLGALQVYLSTTEGRSLFAGFEATFREFYRTVEPDRFRDAARNAAEGKVEREYFQYPDFAVWLLEQHLPSAK